MAAQRIAPFRALVYDPDKVAGLSKVVAPPYDLIKPAQQDELYAQSPYNVVRLELGREPDRYAAAAATLKQWINDGVVRRPDKPAIYLYSQWFQIDGREFRRDGFIVRLLLEEFGQGRVLPHERTFAAAKADRLKLLEAIQVNISSIFGLYSSSPQDLARLTQTIRKREATLEVKDAQGVRHEVRPIDDTTEIDVVRNALSDSRILIADGHHRYETALNYRRDRRAAENSSAGLRPYDYTLVTLVACDDPGLVILPTHRLVRRLKPDGMKRFAEHASEHFVLTEIEDRRALRDALGGSGNAAFAVALREMPNMWLIKLKDMGVLMDLMPALPNAVRELDVAILHGLVFERILGLSDAEVHEGENVEYTIDADAALDAVARGDADGAFLMNAPSIKDVERVTDSAAMMPEKSTYFFPKLLTGLVMNPLSD